MIRNVVTLALGAIVALSTLAIASAQESPPHVFYGRDGNPGDTIGVHPSDDTDTELGTGTVDENGDWYVEVDADQAGDVVISINGDVADTGLTEAERGPGGQTEVSLADAIAKLAMEAEESMGEDEGMEGEDGDMDGDEGMMGGDDDGNMEGDDSSMSGESDHAYPETGTGGLADSNGISAGLIGLLLALSAAAIVGIGLRRVRNRA